jgi:Na+-driven multidrug efflux pump
LYLLQDVIIQFFNLSDDSASVVVLFCNVLAITFIFNGMMFIANAVFNNLGKPQYSMFCNIAKATIGTIPFVFFGAKIAGVEGILIGQALGTIFFGIGTVVVAFYLIALETKNTAWVTETTTA